MNLTKLILNPYSRDARRDLASPYDLHRTLVTRCFPNGQPNGNRMLFRIEPSRPGRRDPGVVVLVQSSDTTPDWTHLPEDDYCIQVEGPKECTLRDENDTPVFKVGQHLKFCLLANPVRRLRKEGRSAPRPDKPNGHGRFRREAILNKKEQHSWLEHKSCEGGFKPLYLHTVTFGVPRTQPIDVTHMKKKSIPHVGVHFEGVIEVIDPEKLILTLKQGIGSAKAFGFGLMTVARAM